MRLDEFKERIRHLPPLPGVLQKLLSELENNASTASSLADVMAHDPALASTVLRLVNSSYYGFARPVPSLSRAVVILGFHAIRKLAISLQMMNLFAATRGASGFDRKKYWELGLATAACSSLLAQQCGRSDLEEMFLAGLLHEIGLLALDVYYPDEMRLALNGSSQDDPSFMRRQKELLGVDYAELGWLLATHWKFPALLGAVIRFHSNPALSVREFPQDTAQAVAIVHCADRYSRAYLERGRAHGDFSSVNAAVWNMVPHHCGHFHGLYGDLDNEIEKMQPFLQTALGES